MKVIKVTRYLWLIAGVVLAIMALMNIIKDAKLTTIWLCFGGSFATFMVAYVQNWIYEAKLKKDEK